MANSKPVNAHRRLLAEGAKTRLKVYEYLVRHMTETCGVAPTVREIAAGVGLRSTSGVTHQLKRLEKIGVISMAASGMTRRIRLVGADWIPPPAELATHKIKNDYTRRLSRMDPKGVTPGG